MTDDSVTMTDSQNTMLRVAEKLLPSKCKPNTLCYCPTMDLIALATEDGSVHVFRLNGQSVFGADFGGENLAVQKLAWKDDGEFSLVYSLYNVNIWL